MPKQPDNQSALEILGNALESMTGMLGDLNSRVGVLEEALPTFGASLTHALSSGGVSTVFVGMLLAELANGDQVRFDELMARTAALAEAKATSLEEPARQILLESVDMIVGVADDRFIRHR